MFIAQRLQETNLIELNAEYSREKVFPAQKLQETNLIELNTEYGEEEVFAVHST